MWYHWLNGNKLHVLKEIKSILIGAQGEIPNICTFEKKIQNECKTTMLWTYENTN